VVGDHTILATGVASGDRVVVAGTYALKAQMLKSQLGEGHGH
jgi:cobalt-zinc-cadmium efflux system membrane fusion protein